MANAATTILLVDDDQLALSTLASRLRAWGGNVIAASEPDGALAMMRASTPDIAVLGYDTRPTSGLELARSIVELSDMPFIVVSAYDGEAIYKEAVALGAVAFLVKPVDPRKLAPTVWAGLHIAENVRNLRQKCSDLTTRLSESREVAVVTGLLMERLQVNQKAAYKGLRLYARKKRRTINDVCREILDSVEEDTA